MTKLDGKTALVTGAAHGIGEATARRFARDGAAVVLADIDSTRGEALAAELGAPHRFIALDVSDSASWTALSAAIASEFGALHIAFLNAGIIARPLGAPASDPGLAWFTPEVLSRVLSVNAIGVALGIMHCSPAIRGSGGGTIVVTGSTAGINPHPPDAIYSASKAAIIQLVRSLAGELDAEGVRLCAVCPGSVDTRMYPPEMRGPRRAAGTIADPDWLAEAVMTVLEHGSAGDLWMARPEDRGYWVFEPTLLPNVIAGEAIPDAARFTPAEP